MQTIEQEGRAIVRGFMEPTKPDPDAMVNHATIFLIDYENALHSPHAGVDHILAAYGHKELAIINGASEAALDAEGFRIRQEWARTYDRRRDK